MCHKDGSIRTLAGPGASVGDLRNTCPNSFTPTDTPHPTPHAQTEAKQGAAPHTGPQAIPQHNSKPQTTLGTHPTPKPPHPRHPPYGQLGLRHNAHTIACKHEASIFTSPAAVKRAHCRRARQGTPRRHLHPLAEADDARSGANASARSTYGWRNPQAQGQEDRYAHTNVQAFTHSHTPVSAAHGQLRSHRQVALGEITTWQCLDHVDLANLLEVSGVCTCAWQLNGYRRESMHSVVRHNAADAICCGRRRLVANVSFASVCMHKVTGNRRAI